MWINLNASDRSFCPSASISPFMCLRVTLMAQEMDEAGLHSARKRRQHRNGLWFIVALNPDLQWWKILVFVFLLAVRGFLVFSVSPWIKHYPSSWYTHAYNLLAKDFHKFETKELLSSIHCPQLPHFRWCAFPPIINITCMSSTAWRRQKYYHVHVTLHHASLQSTDMHVSYSTNKTNLRSLSPLENYDDRATATCRRS
jgi:hypothetical protein